MALMADTAGTKGLCLDVKYPVTYAVRSGDSLGAVAAGCGNMTHVNETIFTKTEMAKWNSSSVYPGDQVMHFLTFLSFTDLITAIKHLDLGNF